MVAALALAGYDWLNNRVERAAVFYMSVDVLLNLLCMCVVSMVSFMF